MGAGTKHFLRRELREPTRNRDDSRISPVFADKIPISVYLRNLRRGIYPRFIRENPR